MSIGLKPPDMIAAVVGADAVMSDAMGDAFGYLNAHSSTRAAASSCVILRGSRSVLGQCLGGVAASTIKSLRALCRFVKCQLYKNFKNFLHV